MGAPMYESVIELDLHGRNRYQAKIAIDAALRRAKPGVYRLRVIHGWHAGTAIRDLVREEYAHHPRVLRVAQGPNPGITDLILREY